MKIMCPKCKRVPYSFSHFRRCKVYPSKHYTGAIIPPPDSILYLIHRPHQSLEYFTYSFMKENGLLDKYTTWKEWDFNMFPAMDWTESNWIYVAWKEAMKDTCMNIPCDECRQKEIDRNTRKSFDKRTLYIQRARQRKAEERDEMQRGLPQ